MKLNLENAYQQNLRQETPQQNTKWYAGDQPTTREIYGQIGRIYKQDKAAATEFANQFSKLQQDKNSIYYNAYSQPTNQAVNNLRSYGIDTDSLTDEWFSKNTDWQQYLRYSETTNGVLQPKKKASQQEIIAYNLYQFQKSMGDTAKANTEWEALKQELGYKAGQTSKNYSDDDIINGIDWKKYPTLAKIQGTFGTPSPIELNSATDFSRDAMYGVIWAARNDGGTGNLLSDIMLSAMGEGNVWQDDPKLRAKLNWNDKNTYAPYTTGMTLDEEVGMYFGKYSYVQSDIDQLRKTIDPNDETAVKNFQKVSDAWERTKTARGQLDSLNEKVKGWLKDSNFTADDIIKKLDILLNNKNYSLLKQMDDSIKNGSDLVQFSATVNFDRRAIEQNIRDEVAKRESRKNGGQFQNGVKSRYNGGQATKPTQPTQTAQPEQPAQTAPSEPVEVDAVTGADIVMPNPFADNSGDTASAGTKGEPRFIASTGKSDTGFSSKPAPGIDYTDSDIEMGAAKDKASNEAAALMEDFTTEDEKIGWTNAGSWFFDGTKKFFSEIGDMATGAADYVKDMLHYASEADTQQYFNTALETSYDIYQYEQAGKQLDEDRKQYEIYKSRFGDVNYLRKPIDEDKTVNLTDDVLVHMHFQEDPKSANGGRYIVTGITGPGIDEDTLGFDTSLTEQAQAIADQETTEARKIISAQQKIGYEKDFAAKNNGEDGRKQIDQEIADYIALDTKIKDEEDYLKNNEESYNANREKMNSDSLSLSIAYKALEWLGMDGSYILQADAILNDVCQYYDQPQYTGSELSELQAYDEMTGGLATAEDRSAYVNSGLQKTQDAIDRLDMEMEYIENNGLKVPDNVLQNMKWKREDLENQKKSFEYSRILTDTDEKELKTAIEAGKAFEKMVLDNAGQINLIGLENQTANGFSGYEQLVRDDEKDIYYYLLGKSVMENGSEYNKLKESYSESYDSQVREQAKQVLDGILKDSWDYVKFLYDDDYGVWTSREANNAAKQGQEDVDAGFWSGVGANIAGTVLSPLESIESTIYLLDRKLNNKRINPKSGARVLNIYKENVRAATFQSIDDTFGADSFSGKLARLGYEIYANRGDSIMNSLVFGPIFKFGGRFGQMLSEFAGASPMGATAALNAAAHAIENGASMEQAWYLAGITFLSETITEAITYSNIQEALGTVEGASKESLKKFFKEWLTKNGVEEAFGESINDIAENAADRYIGNQKNSNYYSEHQKLVDKYRGMGYSKEDAEGFAADEEARGVLHTAFVSYLSAGSDVLIKSAKAAVNTANYYRASTRFNQQMGDSSSMLTNMLNDWKRAKGYAVNEASTETKMDAVAEGEQAVNEQMGNGTEQQQTTSREEQQMRNSEKKQQELERGKKEGAKKETKTVTEEQKQTASDVTIIEESKSADSSTQTAAMSTALTTESKKGADFKADAAAAYISKVFGENGATTVQEILMGAAEESVPIRKVKTAIKNAALGDGTATQLVQSEEFRNASPADKARMLIGTIRQDSSDGNVQRTINNRITDFRRSRIISGLAQEGHFEQAKADRVTAEKAAETTQRAQETLDSQREVENAAAENVTKTAEAFVNDPSADNAEMNHKAVEEHKSAVIVTDQQEQAAQKAQQDQQAAEDKADQSARDAMNEARSIADQQLAQEDQAIAEMEEADRQAEQKAEEEKAAAQAAEEERTGVAEENRQNQAIDQTIDQQNLASEQAEQKKEAAKEKKVAIKERLTDLKQPVSNTEGMLAVRAFGRKLGMNIEFADMDPAIRGRYKDGVIYLNQNRVKAGNMSVGQALVEASLHEITHAMENTGSYGKYRSLALRGMYGDNMTGDVETDYANNADYRAKIDSLIESRKNGVTHENLTHEQADQEIIADFARLNLAQKDVVQRFMDAGMGGNMRNILHNINQALKNFFSKLTGEERKTAEYLRKAERAYQKAMNEVAKTAVHPESDQFSVQQMAQASGLGMTYNDETLQLFLPDGREVDGVEVKITPKMMENTPVGMLINMGLSNKAFKGTDGKMHTQQDDAKQMFADLMNLCARYKDNNLIWEIAGSEFAESFSALKSNSDPQYKTTVDFGTICAKTQAIIDVLSGTMLERIKSIQEWNEAHPDDQKVFTGLTRDDIMMVYDKTHNAKLSVPCPVCYVFSRWMGVPSLLGQMNKFQHEFVVTKKDANGKILYDENNDAVIDWDATEDKVNKYLFGDGENQGIFDKYGDKEQIAEKKVSLTNKINSREENLPKLQEQKLELEKQLKAPDPFAAEKQAVEEQLKNPDLKKGERSKLERKLKSLDRKSEKRIADLNKKIDAAEEKIKTNIRETDQFEKERAEVECFNWVTQALCLQGRKGNSVFNITDENGRYVVDRENFRLTPEEILFDLNRTGEFAGYAKNWRYRTTRGAGMGKAIMPYSGASIGDIINGDSKRWAADQNPFLIMDQAEAKKAFDRAKERVKQQNLVGGQRFQSTSDFRPEWGLDYVMSFLEMQALGSKVQMYTKVVEAVDFLGSIGADGNLSIMGSGDGYHLATAEEIELAKQDTDEGRELASRMGVVDDQTYVMDFSDVTGMEYGKAKEKTKLFNSIQMILVGMNDIHIKLALQNKDIDFIIPWHSSGNSKDVLQQLVGSVGEALNESSDYTDFQTDQQKSHKEKIDGKEKTIDDRTEDEIKLWDARVKLLSEGNEALTEEDRRVLLSNDYTKDLYRRFTEEGYDPDCFGVTLPKAQAEQIFPYEYWDKTSTRENADDNGKRFVEYCDALGLVPRFSQFKDVPGYWKLLIDRKMYENNVLNEDRSVKQYGKYREQQVVDVTKARMNVDPNSTIDPVTQRKADVYQLPESTTAKYGKNYSEQTKEAIYNAKAALEQRYDVSGRYDAYSDGQNSVYGDLTEADIALMNDDYMDAVNSGDMEEAQRLVNEKATEYLNNLLLPDDSDETGFKYHRGPAPTKTFKRYAVLNVSPDGFRAAYAGNKNATPIGVWLDAQNLQSYMSDITQFSDGSFATYIPGDTGASAKQKFSPELLAKYGLKPSQNMLLERGGKHSSDVPNFSQMNLKQDENGNKVTNAKRDGALPHNKLIFEIEYGISDNGDLTDYVRENGRMMNGKNQGLANIQPNQYYDFKTNPNAVGNWGIGGTFRITRLVPYSEVVEKTNQYKQDAIAEAKRLYENGKISEADMNERIKNAEAIQVQKWVGGYHPEDVGLSVENVDEMVNNGYKMKLTDPVTYDDNGNVIPLKDRFNPERNDSRYSTGDVQTEADMEIDRALLESGVVTQDELDQFYGKTQYSSGAELTDADIDQMLSGNKEYSGDVSGYVGGHTGYNAKNGYVRFDNAPSQNIIDNLITIGMIYNPEEKAWHDNGPRKLSLRDIVKAVENGSRGIAVSVPQTRSQQAANTKSAAELQEERFQSVLNSGTNPLEGMNPAMSTAQGPKTRAFADVGGMLRSSDEISQFAKAVTIAQNTYFPDTNYEQIQRAIAWIGKLKQTPNSDGYAEALQAVTNEKFDYRSADGQARMVAVMGLANAKNDFMAQAALADAFMRQGTDLGRALQARKLYKLMTPEGRIASLQNMLKQQEEELAKKGVRLTDENGNPRELRFSEWVLRAAAMAETDEDMQKAHAAAINELAQQIPANWRDRVRSLRMLSMLANPRTHIRNIVGNAMFIPAVGLKNKLGALMELGMKPGERTKTLSLVLSKEVRDFAKQDAQNIKNLLTGEAKFSEATQLRKAQNKLGSFMDAVSDFNSNLLEGEDWLFLKGHYARALGGWMQANGYTAKQLQNDQALLEKGRAYAIQEAQKATYRDFNKTAQTLNQISRNGGVTGFLVDAALPFKKTPANILRRGLEYSPVGLVRSLTSDLYHMKQYNDAVKNNAVIPDKAISPTQFIDRLCSGLSGTAICALGYLLAGSGAVSCGLDDDEDKFEKAKGGQEYAAKFKLFGQDVTFTLDWAAPMSMPFFVGAAIREMDMNEGDMNVEKALNAFGNITEPVFNLSMLDGINTLFKTSQYDDTNTITQIGAKVLTNYATSYVPSVLGAIARTIDTKQRKSFVEQGKGTGVMGTIRYAAEQVQNKIPGLNQQNIAVRDIWGEEKTSSFAERLLENFILPGYINNYTEDPIINEMGRLFDATGDTAMIPKEDPDKYITVNKEKRVLTDKQWDTFKATRNQTAHRELTELLNSAAYRNATDSVRVQMIKDIWSHADKVGRNAVFADYEIDDSKGTTVAEISTNSKITGYKNEMMKALRAEDFTAYDTMVQALEDANVPESEIKEKIAGTYRDEYKKAYWNGDAARMAEIEGLLDYTGFDFDFEKWQEQEDKKHGI